MEEYTKNGIPFTEEIVSINGAYFILFPNAKHTPDDVKSAIAEIRDNRDVVGIKIATESDRDDLFIAKIFRNPLVSDFRWFEVNADPKLIRTERRKGTMPEDYIKTFVLPFREQTKEEMVKKYGEKIFKS